MYAVLELLLVVGCDLVQRPVQHLFGQGAPLGGRQSRGLVSGRLVVSIVNWPSTFIGLPAFPLVVLLLLVPHRGGRGLQSLGSLVPHGPCHPGLVAEQVLQLGVGEEEPLEVPRYVGGIGGHAVIRVEEAVIVAVVDLRQQHLLGVLRFDCFGDSQAV